VSRSVAASPDDQIAVADVSRLDSRCLAPASGSIPERISQSVRVVVVCESVVGYRVFGQREKEEEYLLYFALCTSK
jgi:hypothetical protein